MLIGIEASRADRVQKTGVEWYAWRLIQALKQVPEQSQQQWLLYSNGELSAELGTSPANWHARALSWPPRYLWTQIRLSLELARHRPDVLFVPAHVLPRVIPAKSVVTVHDVGFFRHPELYKFAQRLLLPLMTRDVVRRASRIVTVSEYSKQEIMHFCGVEPERIFVTYPGADHFGASPENAAALPELLAHLRVTGPYFLYVGRLEAKKNILTLIEGFRRYKEDRGLGDPHCLVLTGIPGEGYDRIQEEIRRSGLSECIIQTGYLQEPEKQLLLAGARGLVHPSWYEGFGFTPLEAMTAGCPVVCARAGSLPEVVGVENALWFDPNDPEVLAQHLDRLINDELTRTALIAKGRAWVKRYTWKETAEQTLEILTHWS